MGSGCQNPLSAKGKPFKLNIKLLHSWTQALILNILHNLKCSCGKSWFFCSFSGLTPTTPCWRRTSATGIWDFPWMTWAAAKSSGTTFGAPTWLWGAFSPTLSPTAPSWGNSVATEPSNPSGFCGIWVLLTRWFSASSGIPHFQVFLENKSSSYLFCSLLGMCVFTTCGLEYGLAALRTAGIIISFFNFPYSLISTILAFTGQLSI